nr:hypothetical protein [Evansella caseinilytica]
MNIILYFTGSHGKNKFIFDFLSRLLIIFLSGWREDGGFRKEAIRRNC